MPTSDDRRGPPSGEYRHDVGGQLQFVLVLLLCVVILPTLLRTEGTPLVGKIILVTLAPLALAWNGLHTWLPPVVVNPIGVKVRKRTRLLGDVYVWEELAGYCRDTYADKQLALIAADDRLVALAEVKNRSDLELQLGKRLALLPDPRLGR